MEKMKMQTGDVANENFLKLAALFPNAVTETIDETGEVVRAIDKDILMQEISTRVVEGNEERYQFTWPDKRQAMRLASTPVAATLRPCREESVNFDTTENLYIEGDNLDVLKLLRETYLGKVKMIYIDPPYNTGNDFVYDDDFAEDAGEFQFRDNQYDEQGNRLVQNTESNGRFHTDWLNMIYPRLKVAKDLLADDGVIFISIDEKEVANLRKNCDEIFGSSNFVSNFVWQSRTSISNDYEVSLNHNHTLIYAKKRTCLIWGGDKIDETEYVNPDNDSRGPWKLVPIDANHAGGDTIYPITNPKTGVDYYPPNGRIWCYNKSTMNQLMQDGRIKFGLNDDSAPKRKLFLREREEKGDKKTPSSLIVDNAATTKTGTAEIMGLFDGKKVFDYPKPTELIVKLLRYGMPSGGIILDFFSGSATTAHALFKYNRDVVQKNYFILVQLPENLDKALQESSSSAQKTIKSAIDFLDSINKPHFITEIGKERIRRAGKKIKDEAGLTAGNLDIGFRVLKLDSSNMEDVYYNPTDTKQDDLLSQISNIKPDRTPEDLLFQVMLELGVTLSSKIEECEISGKKVFKVAGNFLIACFDENVTDEVVKAIAKEQPTYAVLRDSSFANDSVAANFEQIFATYSPDTVRRVL